MNTAFESHFSAGRALRRAGRLHEAVAAYEAALALRPASGEAQFNRANALQALGRHAEAAAAYERLLAQAPDDAEALNNRGISLAALGRPAQALDSYAQALAVRPGYVEALHNRGNALAALGRPEEALAGIDAALAARPAHAAALASRGRVLETLGRHAEALACFASVLRQRPSDVEALCDHGNALQALGRHAEALASFDAAVAVAPDHVEALTNRGNVLQALARHGEALDSYARALALRPGDAQVLWNAALAHLALGDYARGWPLYEFRWRIPSLQLSSRDTSHPQWRGEEDLHGRTVLLHAEQGFGDAIQFIRYAPELAARGADVVVACAAPLRRLFSGVEGVRQVVVPPDEALPPFDFHAPLMSLPLACRTTLASIPRTPYLVASPSRQHAWKQRLGPARRRVGLVWSGNPDFPAARLKALPARLLAPLVAAPDCRFVSLQLGAARAEVAELGPGVIDASAELADFEETAALVAGLDLVIGIDTAVAHLAGGLGVPVWILLPYAADWRWLVGREDSPWYPSARLFRQAEPLAWEPVLERVAREFLAWRGDGRE